MKAIAVTMLGVLGLVGIVGYTFFKPPAEATGPIQAPAVGQTAGAATGASSPTVFQIVPEESQARFTIDEILRGEPKTVVGTTNQVAGQSAIDLNDLDRAQVGTILINARTFATDSGQRDRMIQNQILQTDRHEYVSFTPTELVGLPEAATIGQSVRFQIVGHLIVRDVTREVTFDATVTPQSPSRLVGNATTTIHRLDWGITIPQVPAVAGVSDEVRLELDFVATTA
jgi:polyisoprenoid-binding protein YceI